MRAGAWSAFRDIRAARTNWQRARQVADRLPADAPDRASLQIAARTLLCGTLWQVGGSVADTGFDELRDLCTAADDKVSLAIAMTGFIMALTFHNRFREAAQVASEQSELLESIGDPTLTVALLFAAIYAKCQAGEMIEALRLADRLIDLADGDPTKGNLIFGSPLSTAIAMRGHVKMCLGIRDWQTTPPRQSRWLLLSTRRVTFSRSCGSTSPPYRSGRCRPTRPPCARRPRRCASPSVPAKTSFSEWAGSAGASFWLVATARNGRRASTCSPKPATPRLAERFSLSALTIVEPEFALEKARTGDLDGGIEMVRAVVDDAYDSGDMIWRGRATEVLVKLLVRRGSVGDQDEAQAAIDRLAAVPTDPGFVLHELPLLRSRALLSLARGDEDSYRDFLEQHRARAAAAGFDALVAAADATAAASQHDSVGTKF